jgi:ankyrin repeat protein
VKPPQCSCPRARAIAVLLCVGFLAGCQSGPTLHQDIQQGNTVRALSKIEAGKDIDKPDEIGFTPLIYAAKRSNVQAAQGLVSKVVKFRRCS